VDVDSLADVGQLVKGLHGDFQLVADAVYIDGDLRRVFFGEFAG